MTTETIKISELTPYERNARHHEPVDIDAIAKSIEAFGFRDPVGVWGPNNIIVEGHGRVMAAKQLGMTEVPCIRLDDLTDEQRRAYGLAHNKTAELSTWDAELLPLEVQDLPTYDMTAFGFSDVPAAGSRSDQEPEATEDDFDEFDDVEKLDKHYGVPYQGNKSRIADIIISLLPAGERLVDLFGGGGAITHCAILSGKWRSFLYNDLNSMITGLFMDAVHGKYADERRVITREDFNSQKDTDAYVKYIWSFGNNGQAYLWGKDIEGIKCTACHALLDETLHDRRLSFVHFLRMLRSVSDPSPDRLVPLERLQALTQLEALQRLEALQVSNIDYRDYEHKDGDVVYCDVPYEQLDKNSCDDYGVQFNSLEFYEWVKAQKYQVFFSSYEISDKSFYSVKVKSIQSLIGANTNGKKVTEYLYSNMPIEKLGA